MDVRADEDCLVIYEIKHQFVSLYERVKVVGCQAEYSGKLGGGVVFVRAKNNTTIVGVFFFHCHMGIFVKLTHLLLRLSQIWHTLAVSS